MTNRIFDVSPATEARNLTKLFGLDRLYDRPAQPLICRWTHDTDGALVCHWAPEALESERP